MSIRAVFGQSLNPAATIRGEVHFAGDEAPAAAILDRLLHRSVVLNILGPSYRPQDLEELLK